MTNNIVLFAFFGVYGFIIGKAFIRLNPFLMFIGLLMSGPAYIHIETFKQTWLYFPFVIGFIYNFTNPFRYVANIFGHIRYNRQVAKARREERAYFQDKDNYESAVRDEVQRQKRAAEDDIRRQEQEVIDRLKREAEKLRQERELFEQQKRQNNQQSRSSNQNSNSHLDPNNLNDACEILGCKSTDDKATLKKAYKRLTALYHPDKVEKIGGKRKEQALAEMKLINLAWKRIKHRKK